MSKNKIELKVQVGLNEMNLMHDRVFKNQQDFHSNSIQLLVSIASILYFCLSNYSNLELRFFVDIGLVIMLPSLIFTIIILGITNNTKILFFGKYMLLIEKRINKLLETDTNSTVDKIADWEHWRLKYGFASINLLNFDAIIPTILLLFISFFIAFQRLIIVKSLEQNYYNFLLVFSFILLFTFVIIIYFYYKQNVQCKKENNLMSNEVMENLK